MTPSAERDIRTPEEIARALLQGTPYTKEDPLFTRITAAIAAERSRQAPDTPAPQSDEPSYELLKRLSEAAFAEWQAMSLELEPFEVYHWPHGDPNNYRFVAAGNYRIIRAILRALRAGERQAPDVLTNQPNVDTSGRHVNAPDTPAPQPEEDRTPEEIAREITHEFFDANDGYSITLAGNIATAIAAERQARDTLAKLDTAWQSFFFGNASAAWFKGQLLALLGEPKAPDTPAPQPQSRMTYNYDDTPHTPPAPQPGGEGTPEEIAERAWQALLGKPKQAGAANFKNLVAHIVREERRTPSQSRDRGEEASPGSWQDQAETWKARFDLIAKSRREYMDRITELEAEVARLTAARHGVTWELLDARLAQAGVELFDLKAEVARLAGAEEDVRTKIVAILDAHGIPANDDIFHRVTVAAWAASDEGPELLAKVDSLQAEVAELKAKLTPAPAKAHEEVAQELANRIFSTEHLNIWVKDLIATALQAEVATARKAALEAAAQVVDTYPQWAYPDGNYRPSEAGIQSRRLIAEAIRALPAEVARLAGAETSMRERAAMVVDIEADHFFDLHSAKRVAARVRALPLSSPPSPGENK